MKIGFVLAPLFASFFAALAALALPVHAAEPPSAKLIKDLEGVYKHRLSTRIAVPGNPDKMVEADDVVEIVGHGENTAYVRASLTVHDGHRCNIAGVAAVENGLLVYRDPDPDLSDKLLCILTVFRNVDALHLTDRATSKGPSTCSALCGSRSSLGDYAIPMSNKGKIAYLPKLKASKQYQAAVKAFNEAQR